MKTLKDEVLAKVKALEAAQSLEKAIEERLDAEKALQALQAEKEEHSSVLAGTSKDCRTSWPASRSRTPSWRATSFPRLTRCRKGCASS